MSKYIINLQDGEEETCELEGDRLILSVGNQDGVKVAVCYGTREEQQILLSFDVKHLMTELRKKAFLPLMTGIGLAAGENVERVNPEDAN